MHSPSKRLLGRRHAGAPRDLPMSLLLATNGVANIKRPTAPLFSIAAHPPCAALGSLVRASPPRRPLEPGRSRRRARRMTLLHGSLSILLPVHNAQASLGGSISRMLDVLPEL